jgi:peptidoglycan/LPS O-acetylase OafA/YrhL
MFADAKRPDSTSQETPHYLPFVDGLRAVSILAVVAYHVGLSGLPGGFVGVDIFFVISGFLIINQIRSALERGHFSLWSFYMRRSLRILPPLIIMLLAVYGAAPFILPTPGVYLEFMRGAILSPLMASNVLFYFRQGYFDLNADEKPFLHTWTLSVEEQFYIAAPILLVLVFRLGKERFGVPALIVALALCAVSLAGAITQTTVTGRNPAFYLAHWRAWEFIAGGLIGGTFVAALGRAPRLAAEVIGGAGIVCIALSVLMLDARTPYPSWRAILPVAGAALTIWAGFAQPHILVSRFLSARWLVAIGLVSYAWYLWHWPILSFLRILRLGEPSLIPDLLGGGVAAFFLACTSYVFLEQPIRRWRSARPKSLPPLRIVQAGVVACLGAAALGGISGFVGYRAVSSSVAARYGTEGKGTRDNGCRIVTAAKLPPHCGQGKFGLLLGDSHADSLYPTFALRFEQQHIQLVSLARGGCNPLVFAPSQRAQQRRHGCANLLGPFEQLLERKDSLASVVITSAWSYREHLTSDMVSGLVGQFDPARTRIVLIGPVPLFHKSSLDCIVLSDRFGDNRDRCIRLRSEVEEQRSLAVEVLQAAARRSPNVRYIDPIDLFCDTAVCRPFGADQVFFRDAGHVLPSGADRIFDGFESDFRWLTGPQ